MKTIILKTLTSIFLLGGFSFYSKSQTIQISIGSPTAVEAFNDVKLDPTDGGSIYVGTINTGSGNGTDLFFAKLNSTHQVVWQKSIPNPGDDVFYK